MILLTQHPFIMVWFLLAGCLLLLSTRLKKYACPLSWLSGVAVIAMLIYGLYCGLPLKLLLILLTLLLLFWGILFRKGSSL